MSLILHQVARLPRPICRSFWTGQDRNPENLALQELLEKLGE